MSFIKQHSIKAVIMILAVMLVVLSMPICALANTQNGGNKKPAVSYLFIGNSISYYNNMPQMFAHIVEAKTGEEIEISTLMYAARTPVEHGQAIEAVIRTEGNAEALTEEEKQLFLFKVASDTWEYDEQVYDDYKDVILNEDGSVKHFDYLVIQDHGRDQTQDLEGFPLILQNLSDPDMHIVITMPNYTLESGKTIEQMKVVQDEYDQNVELLKNSLLESDLEYQDLKVAYFGRAFYNYFFYFGNKYALDRAPEEYNVYVEEDDTAEMDLLVEGDLHATQLGTYLHAATLYTTIFEDTAEDTIPMYRAQTEDQVHVIGRNAAGTNYTIANGPFREDNLLNSAWFIADQTTNGEMNLSSVSDADSWKNNDEKSNMNLSYELEQPEIKSVRSNKETAVIRWKKVEGAEKYMVYYRGETGWKRLGTTTDTKMIDEDVDVDGRYTYTVRCIREDENAYMSDYDHEGMSCEVQRTFIHKVRKLIGKVLKKVGLYETAKEFAADH